MKLPGKITYMRITVGGPRKTPEEIKSGLERCNDGRCDGCAYDAIAYILQLEQINADFAERTARLENSATSMAKIIESAYKQRDAAFKELERRDREKGCVTCALYKPRHYTPICTTCKKRDKWEWCGLPEVQTE